MDIKGSETIVIQLGSLHLRIGFANQLIPHMIPNVIAYRSASATPSSQVPTCDAETLYRAYTMVQEYLQSEGYLKAQAPKLILPKKKNRKEQAEEDTTEIEIQGVSPPTDTSQRPNYLVGNDAYNLDPNDSYEMHWPILRGHFNITENQTFWTVVNDIEKILEHTLIKVMKVPRAIFQQFSVVLILPDAFYKDQVKALIDILLRQLGMRAVFLQQESVSAIFGAGVPNACVVDIGARHINVVCVEEGVILPKTHIRQMYSGRDIDIFLMRILVRPDCDSLDDLRMVESLKKEACRLIQSEEKLTYQVSGRASPLSVNSDNAILVVGAHSLFHATLLEISSGQPRVPLTLAKFLSYDTDDYLLDLVETPLDAPCHPVTEKVLNLDQMIINSVCALESTETRKKMANSILLCGGGGMFPDLVALLEDRLIRRFPEDTEIDRVEVKASITHSDSSGNKEHIPPNHLMWVGGTVIPLLDSTKELWITKNRWLGEWVPTEAKEELRAQFVSFDNPHQLADMCKKWRKDRPLEGGVRHIKEKGTFIW